MGEVIAEKARRMYERHVAEYLPPSERTDWFMLTPADRHRWLERAAHAMHKPTPEGER